MGRMRGPVYRRGSCLELACKLFADVDRAADILRTDISVTELNLHCEDMGVKGLRRLSQCLSDTIALKILKFRGAVPAPVIRSIALELSRNRTIRVIEGLAVERGQGLEDFAEMLVNNATLQEILLEQVDEAGAGCLANALKQNHTLRTLTICESEDKEVQIIADAVVDNHSLLELHFIDCELSDSAARFVANLLKVNCTLRRLSLGTVQSTGDQALAILAEALTQNNTLEDFRCDLSSSDSSSDSSSNSSTDLAGAERLALVLSQSISLRSFRLQFDSLGDDGARHFAQPLLHNRTLRCLDLSGCGIGPLGTRYLSEALANNTTLEKLVLSGNRIEDEGAEYLAAAIRQNTTLRELHLQDMIFGHQILGQGTEALANALAHNQSIQVLDISGGIVNFKEGGHIFGEMLKTNRGLRSLIIDGSSKYYESLLALAEGLKDNCTLRNLTVHPIYMMIHSREVGAVIESNPWTALECVDGIHLFGYAADNATGLRLIRTRARAWLNAARFLVFERGLPLSAIRSIHMYLYATGWEMLMEKVQQTQANKLEAGTSQRLRLV